MAEFEKFTERARRVLTLAKEEAEQLGARSISGEHLLLGLVREEDGVGFRVLKQLGLDRQSVESATATRIQRSEPSSDLHLSDEGKRILASTVDEARRSGLGHVDTEHLLLAIVGETEGIGAKALGDLGVTPDAIRDATSQVLRDPTTNQKPDS